MRTAVSKEVRLFCLHPENEPLCDVDLVSRQLDTADADLLKTQNQLADAWSSLIPDFPTRKIHVLPSIEHAVRMIRGIESERGGSVDVLVTGSLLLVGGVVEVAGLVDVAL